MRKGKVRHVYENINAHIIFDIKIDKKFTGKSILVADGHTTAPPSLITYSSVVSRYIVRNILLISSLNGL